MQTVHDVLRFVRETDSSIEAVWRAYADVDRRVEWSVPNGEMIVYDATGLAEGGLENYRCGPPGDLSTFGTVQYYIVDPPHRLIYSDMVRHGGQILAVALLTWEFGSIEHGTRITVVDHVTSLVGQGMIDGHRNGHDKALDQLLQWLSAHGEQTRGDR